MCEKLAAFVRLPNAASSETSFPPTSLFAFPLDALCALLFFCKHLQSNWCPENGRHLVLRCKVAVETVLQLFNPFMGCTISASLHLIASKVDSLFHLVRLLPCRQLDAVSILLRMEQLGFFMIECFLDALHICFWVPSWSSINLLQSIKSSCRPGRFNT